MKNNGHLIRAINIKLKTKTHSKPNVLFIRCIYIYFPRKLCTNKMLGWLLKTVALLRAFSHSSAPFFFFRFLSQCLTFPWSMFYCFHSLFVRIIVCLCLYFHTAIPFHMEHNIWSQTRSRILLQMTLTFEYDE